MNAEYMRRYREHNPEFVAKQTLRQKIKRQSIERICPDCGIRELEKKCQYCSECAEARRYISGIIRQHTWKERQ